ncbi:MAG: hypothetical protein Q9161_001758 [Pseudevernia consocians]
MSNLKYKVDGSGRLHGRIAIVTGASSGMGRGIALALAREGAHVVCSDIKEECAQHGFEEDKHIPTHTKFSKIDILINNAGVWWPLRDFIEETDEQWDIMMAVNGKGCATAMREAIKQMIKQPITESGARGRIVNISSAAGITAIRREATYAASKAAVTMLTKNVALDHAKDSININAVCPGVVRTAQASTNFRDPAIIAEMRKGTPWPRLGEPIDVANMVVFLCTDEAQWITGQNIAVDGGFTVGIML